MPSDHVIGDREAFLNAIDVGAPHAENGAIVTFGAGPTEANTQYGYIEADTSSASPDGAFPSPASSKSQMPKPPPNIWRPDAFSGTPAFSW